MTALLPSVPSLVLDQDQVLTSSQAIQLFGREYVRGQLRARRWQRPCPRVLVTHNGPLTDGQLRWAALLSCAPRSALAGGSALAIDGVPGFEPTGRTEVTQPLGAGRPRWGRVKPHWSSMLDVRDVHPLRTPRRTLPPRSMLDEASWSDAPRRARSVILAGIQRRATRTYDLREALSRRGKCRHRRLIVESILDAHGGIQSLPERDFESIRRRFGLPEPTRQRALQRSDGRYYLDVDWDEFGTSVEIHGIPHLEVLRWDADLFRANEVVIRGPRQLTFSSYAVRHERRVVGDQTRRLLLRGGWPG